MTIYSKAHGEFASAVLLRVVAAIRDAKAQERATGAELCVLASVRIVDLLRYALSASDCFIQPRRDLPFVLEIYGCKVYSVSSVPDDFLVIGPRL